VPKAYYNEIDPFAAAWLKELISQNLIAPGEVDTRSIVDVQPRDLAGFTQCHFFAGIGVWSYALREAGFSDKDELWSGSCPCQPFSDAGLGKGFKDERHLWPAWFRLVRKCKPKRIFGEQVASSSALKWFDAVSLDLETVGYAVGATSFPACGVGAPHIRQRLWFVADTGRPRLQRPWAERRSRERGAQGQTLGGCAPGALADAGEDTSGRDGETVYRAESQDGGEREFVRRKSIRPSNGRAVSGFWGDAEWVECSDGKSRPIESGVTPVVNGFAPPVGHLRGYGNAINAEAAAAFARAYREIRG